MPQTPAKFYSQNGEDFLLWALLGGKAGGFFIDVGAFDGIHLSNSYAFERAGWSGICVEPHPDYAGRLTANRRGSVCVHAACVGDRNRRRVRFLAEPLGLLSGIKADRTPNLAGRYAARGMRFPGLTPTEVGATTLDRLLERHPPPADGIDFLSIDTEGTELDVLRGLDLTRHRPRVIVVEANSTEHHAALVAYLAPRGYTLARQLEQNLFFTRQEADRRALREAILDCRLERTEHPMGPQATRHHGGRVRQADIFTAPNVLRQPPGRPVSDLLRYFPAPDAAERPLRFAHVVSPFVAPPDSEAERAQHITFEAMAAARRFADGAAVEMVGAHCRDDRPAVPVWFDHAVALERTVADVAAFREPRPLPLVYDLLDAALAAAGQPDFVILSNVDIVPLPHFYRVLAGLARRFDALTVNRRTVAKTWADPGFAGLAEMDQGAAHGGFDCLVFRASLYPAFRKDLSCVGRSFAMRSLIYNLVAAAERMLMLTDVHMTYHLGNDEGWRRSELADYEQHNERQYRETLAELAGSRARLERLRPFCLHHGERFVPAAVEPDAPR